MISSHDFDAALADPHIQEIAVTAYRRLHHQHLSHNTAAYDQAIEGVLQEGRLSHAEYYATWHLISEQAQQEHYLLQERRTLAPYERQGENKYVNN